MGNQDKRHFIIDTDTASDDVIAILMALQWPDVEVDAITAVFGNVTLEQASINARYTVELCGKETPVYEGAARGLLHEPTYAYFFHGDDGMGNMNYPAPKLPATNGHAVDELVRRFGEAPGEITLVTLGPLTNIALALMREPRLADWVKECYVMGGAACSVGNITPAAEFNIWCDPEAAQIVFHSGMKTMMVGWELCRGEASLNELEQEMIYGFDNDLARFTIDSNRTAIKAIEMFGGGGLALPDPITVAIALDRAVCAESAMNYVDISLGEQTRGMTIVDQMGVTQKEPNVEVCWAIDIPLWKETLYKTIR